MVSLSVLIVDSDRRRADTLALEARRYQCQVTMSNSFDEASKEIRRRAPLIVVAPAVIGAFRGVLLAQAAIRASSRAHAVMYGSLADLVLARQAFRTRVFFERQTFVRHALPRYLTANLPGLDRRDVRVADRRTTFRGGRRASDVDVLWAQACRH
jgi:hypothetical protein